ncbi:hypothetical protein FKB34_08855 [Glycocaulis profundi]|nr:hypothetical protein FKB34_08855 [Glycocaulis profundi]
MRRSCSDLRVIAHALLAGLWLIISVSASAYAIVDTSHDGHHGHVHSADHDHDHGEDHAPCQAAPCHVHWLGDAAQVSVFSPRYAAPQAARLSDSYLSRGDPPGLKPPMI